MEKALEERMEAVKKARENHLRNRKIAMEVVDFLTTKELTMNDVKVVLDEAYNYAKRKAILK